MAYNLPSGNKKRLSFGPGRIYLGPEGSTPTIEVGFVKGNSVLSFKRSKLEVFQGSPQALIEQFVTKEEVSLKATGIEWNLDNLAFALAAGETSVSGAQEVLDFGGDMTVKHRALRFVHIMPDGSTIDVQMFNVEGSGELDVTFNETDLHELPFEFRALEGTTGFDGVALAAKKKLVKIIRTQA
jgi:hypothetical protein